VKFVLSGHLLAIYLNYGRTLQIFAYSGCIPFLVNNRLHPSGTFLIHGLKKDALFDLPKGGHAKFNIIKAN
jgi:hypothetical protein